MTGSKCGTHQIRISLLGELTKYIFIHAKCQLLLALGIFIFHHTFITLKGQLHPLNAHGVRIQHIFLAADLLGPVILYAAGVIVQLQSLAVIHQSLICRRILSQRLILHMIHHFFKETINNGSRRSGDALIVRIDHKYHVLIGNSNTILTTHAVKIKAVLAGAPDLVAIAIG